MDLDNLYKLFPKNEEWATGDEALDLNLNLKFKETIQNLSVNSITSFYCFGIEIKPRAYNPLFKMNIELVTKGLLAILFPKEYNDNEFKKLKGNYFNKEKIVFQLSKKDIVVDGLRMLNKFRYENQLDFFLETQNEIDRNPFIFTEIKRSPTILETKIIFKDVTRFLALEIEKGPEVEFIKALRNQNILIVEGLGEFWFSVDRIYSITI